jgi:hypothetical protein
MAFFRRVASIVFIVVGGAAFSQAPEFAQQYRQRIGGALDELHTIVSTFEAQAAKFGLDREEALETYTASRSPFLLGQGKTMRETIERYTKLSFQQGELTREPAVTRPLLLLRRLDGKIARNAWRDFIPALPIDSAGLVWLFAGCLCGWAISWTFSLLGKSSRNRRSEAIS